MIKKDLSYYLNKYSLKSVYLFIKNIIIEKNIESKFNKLYTKKIFVKRGIKENNPRKLIISLTSYPKRFKKLHLVLYSLLTQKLKPNKIVLFLSKKEVEREDDIPQKILFLKRFGLEIKFIKENYKSYNKLFFTLREFSDYNIITVDDDTIYPSWFLEKLYLKHIKYPKDIVCYRAHLIKKLKNKIKPYVTWGDYNFKKFQTGKNLFPTGVSGVLYPTNSLNKEVLNSKVFLKICPLADDIWFKAMSLLNNTNCRRVFDNKNIDFLTIRSTQETNLMEENVVMGKNDEQIKKVFDKYKLYKYLSDNE